MRGGKGLENSRVSEESDSRNESDFDMESSIGKISCNHWRNYLLLYIRKGSLVNISEGSFSLFVEEEYGSILESMFGARVHPQIDCYIVDKE